MSTKEKRKMQTYYSISDREQIGGCPMNNEKKQKTVCTNYPRKRSKWFLRVLFPDDGLQNHWWEWSCLVQMHSNSFFHQEQNISLLQPLDNILSFLHPLLFTESIDQTHKSHHTWWMPSAQQSPCRTQLNPPISIFCISPEWEFCSWMQSAQLRAYAFSWRSSLCHQTLLFCGFLPQQQCKSHHKVPYPSDALIQTASWLPEPARLCRAQQPWQQH